MAAGGRAGEAPGSSQGPAVDRTGQPVKDPSPNVLDLVRAAIERQDDLRDMSAAHAREMRETARMYESRLDTKDQQLRAAEAGRLDAIQTRSDLTVQRAAEVQAAQQQALATQVTSTADTFRASIAAELAPIKASIEDLRRAQYEQQGEKSSKVETSTDARDAIAIEAARIQAASQRTQVYGLIVAAIVLALSIYAAFHH
jgi:hypothetical protein